MSATVLKHGWNFSQMEIENSTNELYYICCQWWCDLRWQCTVILLFNISFGRMFNRFFMSVSQKAQWQVATNWSILYCLSPFKRGTGAYRVLGEWMSRFNSRLNSKRTTTYTWISIHRNVLKSWISMIFLASNVLN